MDKECKLGSFLAHPQLKPKHANAESAKLTNHDTDGSGGEAPMPAGGDAGGDTPDKPAPITGGY